MRAAKEKKLNRLPESNVNEMDSEPARIPATKTTASVVNRIAGYDFRTRKFQKSPIGTSEKNHFIVLVENQRSPRKRIGENVVQLRRLHWAPELSLYRAYFNVSDVDPLGWAICKCTTTTVAPTFSGGSQPASPPITGTSCSYHYTKGNCSDLDSLDSNLGSNTRRTCDSWQPTPPVTPPRSKLPPKKWCSGWSRLTNNNWGTWILVSSVPIGGDPNGRRICEYEGRNAVVWERTCTSAFLNIVNLGRQIGWKERKTTVRIRKRTMIGCKCPHSIPPEQEFPLDEVLDGEDFEE